MKLQTKGLTEGEENRDKKIPLEKLQMILDIHISIHCELFLNIEDHHISYIKVKMKASCAIP
jgi:hypothetical protein